MANNENKCVCRICELESLHEFEYWRIITNEFPYDRVAEKHSMLVPKRHVKEKELTAEESQELIEIKYNPVLSEYTNIVQNNKKLITIPEHFHLHLLVAKDF